MPKLDKGISNKVTKAWAVQDIWAEINGYEICNKDIVDFETMYGGCQVPAKLQFIDSKGLTTGDINKTANISIGGSVTIGFTTAENCEHEETYIIKKVNTENNNSNQKLIEIELEDIETRNMKQAHVSKGYPGKKFSEVVESHIKEIKSTDLPTFKETIIAKAKNENPLNMVIPANINFYDFLNFEMKEKGYKYFKDRFNSYLVHGEHREWDNLKSLDEVFEFDSRSPFSFNRIIQFTVDGFNFDEYQTAIPMSTTSINIQDANSPDAVSGNKGTDTKISKKKPNESKNDVEISGVKASELSSLGRGSKQGSKVAGDKQYFDTMSNAQKASIWVPGRVNNLIGKKIKVVFPKPTYYAKTQNDHIFSGEWEVEYVRDKIVGGYFLQEMFLKRPGGTNV
jgi:hypothetical protein